MSKTRAMIVRSLWLVAMLVLLAACSPNRAPTHEAAPQIPLEPDTEVLQPEPTAEPVQQEPAEQAGKEAAAPQEAWPDREIFRLGLITEAQGALDELPGASLYQIDLSISPDMVSLQGHEMVTYTNHESMPLQEIYFQLFPNAAGGSSTVTNLQVDGVIVEPDYEPDRKALRAALPAALEPGESVLIELDFVVEVPQEMGGTYGTFGYINDILVLDEFYPVIPVYDQDGWHYHVPVNGDLTYLDASFYLVRVRAPQELVVVASGVEVARESSAGVKTVSYAAGPARDFYLAASDQFSVVSRQVGETTINSYAFPEREDGAELVLDIAEEALRIYNRRFGLYPYSEMDLVSTPMQALGIEYPGIMGITMDAYDLSGELLGLPNPVMLRSTVAHEVAHQWFYNVVGNDQVGAPWLDEAVVQYITGLYYRDRDGMAGYNGYRDSWYYRWDRVKRAEIPIGMPSEAYNPQDYSPIVYGRGPLFMEALADEMGEQAFEAFLRDYYQSHLWGIGTGEAFRQMAEQHCGCDLTSLFEAWVYE